MRSAGMCMYMCAHAMSPAAEWRCMCHALCCRRGGGSHIHTCTHMCMYTRAHACTYIHMHIHVYEHAYTQTCAHPCICMHVHMQEGQLLWKMNKLYCAKHLPQVATELIPTYIHACTPAAGRHRARPFTREARGTPCHVANGRRWAACVHVHRMCMDAMPRG